jgi:hypothetical protein
MDLTLSHLQQAQLPRPDRGGSRRFQLGRLELILEPVRGGYTLLCLDGSKARTWSLALARHGELWLQCRLPRWPLRVGLQDTMVLVPHSRTHGYVQVPLVPTVVWRAEGRPELVVAELMPAALAAEWDEVTSAVVQRSTSAFLQRLPLPDEQPRGVVPLTVRNDSDAVQSPDALPIALRDDELRVCREHLIAMPRRLRIDEQGRMSMHVRPREGERRR